MRVCLSVMCVCVTRVCGIQKRVLGPLALKVQGVGSCHMGVGNPQEQVLLCQSRLSSSLFHSRFKGGSEPPVDPLNIRGLLLH